jgi:hypothetical protein
MACGALGNRLPWRHTGSSSPCVSTRTHLALQSAPLAMAASAPSPETRTPAVWPGFSVADGGGFDQVGTATTFVGGAIVLAGSLMLVMSNE